MRHHRTLALITAAALTAAGCASTRATPAIAHPVAPAAWHGTTAATPSSTDPPESLARWWDRLGDATLTTLIDRALTANPDVRMAQARLRQARAQQAQAAAALWPTVSASGSASARRSGNRALGLDGSTSIVNTTTGSYGGSLDASWEPDIFGGLRQGRDGATADLAAVAADLAGVHVSLAAAVPNGAWVEYIPQLDAVASSRLVIDNGHAVAPDTPGLGIEWLPGEIARRAKDLRRIA